MTKTLSDVQAQIVKLDRSIAKAEVTHDLILVERLREERRMLVAVYNRIKRRGA